MSNTWEIIAIVFLIIVIIGIVLFNFYFRNSYIKPKAKEGELKQFGGDLDVQNNKIELKCGEGEEINVIDAWYEVYDPNYQLSGEKYTSGLYATGKKGELIGPIISDGSANNMKELNKDLWGVSSDSIPLSKTNGGNAFYSKLGKYTTIEGYDSTGEGQCLIQNALPMIAKAANGKTTVTIDTKDLPSPCSGNMPGYKNNSLEIHQDNSNYNKVKSSFPIGSLSKKNTDPNNNSSTLGQQGYYLHGIYTCSIK